MKKIVLGLDDSEMQALAGLIDAGVRATGLRSVKEAAALLDKIEKAVAEARENNAVELAASCEDQ